MSTLKTFAIQTKGGRDYIAKLDIDNRENGITIDKNDKGDEALSSFIPGNKFITLIGTVVLIPMQQEGKNTMFQMKFSEIPTGSETLAIAVDNISEINLISDNTPFMKSMKAKESGLVLASGGGDVEKSSKLIHKFGR